MKPPLARSAFSLPKVWRVQTTSFFTWKKVLLKPPLARSAISLPWDMFGQIAGLMIISISSLLIFVGQTNNNRVYAQALSMDESITPGITYPQTNIFNPNPWVSDCLSY